jgi:hypothetical protein
MAERNLGRFAKALEQPAYVAVGFGVLGFQRAQVYRRACQLRLGALAGTALAGTRFLGDELGQRLEPVRQTASGAAGDIAEHLPTEARDFVKAAGNLVADIPGEAREMMKEAVAFGRFALQVVQAPARRQSYP